MDGWFPDHEVSTAPPGRSSSKTLSDDGEKRPGGPAPQRHRLQQGPEAQNPHTSAPASAKGPAPPPPEPRLWLSTIQPPEADFPPENPA